jgi:predicted enzyme involved in methoxymalonyl-ACP biosynthesis
MGSKMAKTQSAKFEIEKFNGKNNFEIWKVKMHDLLVQQGVVKVLLGKEKQPTTITDED